MEPAYMLAIKADQEIRNYAYEKRILLISPTNLLVSLKMIASLWRQALLLHALYGQHNLTSDSDRRQPFIQLA